MTDDDLGDFDWSGGAPEALPAPVLLPQLGHERILYSTAQMSRPMWLVKRKMHRTIGASHMAGIMQRHPFSTPISVAANIKGLSSTAFAPEEVFRMELGTVCESQIRRVAAASLEVPIVQPGNILPRYLTTWPQVLQHPTIDCLTCNLDGVVVIDGERMPLECKWTSWRNRTAWRSLADTHDITETIGTSVLAYYIQVQTQLAITGLKRGLLIGIVGEDAACRMLMNIIQERTGDDAFDPRSYDVVICTIERDEKMIADIEKVAPAFYRRFIEGDEVPPVTDPAHDLPALRDAWRAANPPKPEASIPELEDLARRYLGVVKEIGRGKKIQTQRMSELQHALNQHKVEAFRAGGYRITYKARVDGVRVFRVAEVKGD